MECRTCTGTGMVVRPVSPVETDVVPCADCFSAYLRDTPMGGWTYADKA
jgi:hypothetical protein